MKRCTTDRTECPQTSWSWMKPKGLCFYHGKLEAEKMQPADRYLSETELDSMFGGRARNDGRRLDAYTRI